MAAADEFMRDFITKEYEALRAKYGDPKEVFVPKLQAVNALFTRDVTTKSGITRTSSANLDALRPHQSAIVRRRVLSARDLTHPKLGALSEYVLTSPEGGDGPEAKYYVREADAGMRIVSYYLWCRDCSGSGRINGKTCSHCHGSGWTYADGLTVD